VEQAFHQHPNLKRSGAGGEGVSEAVYKKGAGDVGDLDVPDGKPDPRRHCIRGKDRAMRWEHYSLKAAGKSLIQRQEKGTDVLRRGAPQRPNRDSVEEADR